MIRFRLYKDQTGETRWQIIASNGRNIGNGSESYVEKRKARQTLDMIIQAVKDGNYSITEDID